MLLNIQTFYLYSQECITLHKHKYIHTLTLYKDDINHEV